MCSLLFIFDAALSSSLICFSASFRVAGCSRRVHIDFSLQCAKFGNRNCGAEYRVFLINIEQNRNMCHFITVRRRKDEHCIINNASNTMNHYHIALVNVCWLVSLTVIARMISWMITMIVCLQQYSSLLCSHAVWMEKHWNSSGNAH